MLDRIRMAVCCELFRDVCELIFDVRDVSRCFVPVELLPSRCEHVNKRKKIFYMFFVSLSSMFDVCLPQKNVRVSVPD